MTRLAVEFRHARRALAGRPVVSLTVIASLGLGLGLAMLTFTLVDAILIRPLRFPNAHELLMISTEFRPESGYNYDRFSLSAPEVTDYASQNRTVSVAAFQPPESSSMRRSERSARTRIRSSSAISCFS